MNINIEAERARAQLTKEKLSSQLGISIKTYGSYVKGNTPIPSDILLNMTKIFGCSADYLLGISEQPRRSAHSNEKSAG